jgi:hypothetical protein
MTMIFCLESVPYVVALDPGTITMIQGVGFSNWESGSFQCTRGWFSYPRNKARGTLVPSSGYQNVKEKRKWHINQGVNDLNGNFAKHILMVANLRSHLFRVSNIQISRYWITSSLSVPHHSQALNLVSNIRVQLWSVDSLPKIWS